MWIFFVFFLFSFFCSVAVFVWLVVIEAGIFPQVKRGFFCDDRTISMRFNGETVTTLALLCTVCFIYPILWISEACFFVPVSIKSSRFIESARRAWRWFKEFLFGLILHLFFIDGIKVWRKSNVDIEFSFVIIILNIVIRIHRCYLVSFVHIFWILAAQMPYKPVQDRKSYTFKSLHNFLIVRITQINSYVQFNSIQFDLGNTLLIGHALTRMIIPGLFVMHLNLSHQGIRQYHSLKQSSWFGKIQVLTF